MTKVIMVQGTMSNVGKSLITAGLCRVFWQDGYRVAPFKAQNMSLNSYITEDGLEMGRAQVVQAEACGIAPSVFMNPILLKPVSDKGSQVIVNGKVWGNLHAAEYYQKKQALIPEIQKAYDQLAAQADIIVIEGAGSPAEINLKDNDIVNMHMAKLVDAPVLLVGDIDRGGVFAQLLGTMLLLEPEEQDRVQGFILNKFRGDASILKPGLVELEQRTNKPVVGVMPYLQVDIDDEDSLSERLERSAVQARLDIAVICLPKISNFTDFAMLEAEPDFGVRYVHRIAELGQPDMIVLPGTKNTIADLYWMRQNGLEAMILKQVAAGCILFGICGGYQMLGQQILDTAGVEAGGSIRGMGLLPAETTFATEKRRTRVTGIVQSIGGPLAELRGAVVSGYEIHMGTTQLEASACRLVSLEEADGAHLDGCWSNHVYGTYLHGFFDTDSCRTALHRALCRKKGIAVEQELLQRKPYREQQYDRLADAIRENLDMEQIYRILGVETV